ncbi:methyl-accepting chemotaxis protein [Desulfobacterales bacterium HSG16]|nr:methyl-accepting chemotaxis protein [Desulfobacterales bacterium HSG16]
MKSFFSMLKNIKLRKKLVCAFLSVAVLIAITGGFGVYYTNNIAEHGREIGEKLAPLDEAAMRIRINALSAHLKIEEILSGDTSENIEDVWNLLDESIEYCNLILKGGKKDDHLFIAAEDQLVREKIKTVRQNVEKLIESARSRYANLTNSSGAGSKSDQIFDSLYEKIQKNLSMIGMEYKKQEDAAVVHLSVTAQYLLANGHLFLEEFITGDEEVNIENVRKDLKQALNNVNEIGTQIGRSRISGLAEYISNFIAEAENRVTSMQNSVVAGSNIEKEFDNEFEMLMSIIDEAENLVYKSMYDGLTKLDKAIAMSIFTVSIITSAGFVLAVFCGLLISGYITSRILKVVNLAEKLSKGDLTVEAVSDSEDEIGHMTKDLNDAISYIRSIIQELSKTSNILLSSSEELSSVSTQMAASSEEMDSQAVTVTEASDQISSSIEMVASSAEESSSSVTNIAAMTEEMSNTFAQVANMAGKTNENVYRMARASGEMSSTTGIISAAVEEISVSLNDVAQNTTRAKKVSQDANLRTENVNEKMDSLVKASRQIGKIVGVIKDIADQTNMLALNATIEAAGAGDAGKGFAVVAGEVKELARQSADATDEIAGQIEQIQGSTDDAVEAIRQINRIINDIADINNTISLSVDEQTKTSGQIAKSVAENAEMVKNVANDAEESSALVEDISKSVKEASITAKDLARHVDQLSRGVREVAKSSAGAVLGIQNIAANIRGIGMSSKETASRSVQINTSSKELAEMAVVLSKVVKRFNV